MSDKLPKVSIAVVGVVIAQIGGFIWWTAQQASTISNLEETVNILTVENNATDKTNLIRDVQRLPIVSIVSLYVLIAWKWVAPPPHPRTGIFTVCG